MRFVTVLTAEFALLFSTVSANTEKTIFSAPNPAKVSSTSNGLEDLRLDILTPSQPAFRTSIAVEFPVEGRLSGTDSWYLLRHLTPDQRYEVRICWSASQPSNFNLDTFDITHVFDTPELIRSLAVFSDLRIQNSSSWHETPSPVSHDLQESLLFLRLQSSATFSTANETLMRNPLPVHADIILDPYLYNVFPRSLTATAQYLILIATTGALVSGRIWKLLVGMIEAPKKHND